MKNRKVSVILLFLLVSFGKFSYAQSLVKPEAALLNYLHTDSANFKWELKNQLSVEDVSVYNLLLTSQRWRKHTWTHQLTIIVPKATTHKTAMLFISGGSNNVSGPNWNLNGNKEIFGLGNIAKQNNAVVAVLRQTPNQPLFKGIFEDALISYTLHQYKESGDSTWPLLFPMVKSATAAMTAVQQFGRKQLDINIDNFLLSGASKRGWTTWLTAAVDKRVIAIAPMVIDMINMPVSMKYQTKVWKGYSAQIEDYVKLGLVQDTESASANSLITMIDPYQYRHALKMPKMIVMGTNDEYWPVDNIKNYLDSIPGNNLLKYIPNVGHSLGDGLEAFNNLDSFFGCVLQDQPLPTLKWTNITTKTGVKVDLTSTADKLIDVIVWQADSPDLDFRNDTWSSTSLGMRDVTNIQVFKEFPKSGHRAFFIDLKYKNIHGKDYTLSTRVFMTNQSSLL